VEQELQYILSVAVVDVEGHSKFFKT
jgi:uncharacterized protein GlcG (DUF336 family)